MEAKANLPELSAAGKVIRSPRKKEGEDERREPSQKSRANHERICAAIAEAGRALAALELTTKFTAVSHYQLANRLAFSWKLASLGIPVALTYLGFLGDRGIGNVGLPFTDADNWHDTFKAHALPLICLETPEVSASKRGLPFWFAVRSRSVLTQSPPVNVSADG
jgi:hypothetical protein